MTYKEYIRAMLIIAFTGVLGGAIAFLGNQLGRYIGRRKMSIFHLRPRYTSMLITVITGMMIASLTLAIAMIVSEPIRIAFLNPQEYQQKVKYLEDLIAKQRRLQQTDLVYKKQELILSAVIKANPDINKMKAALKEVVAQANKAAIKKSKDIARERGEVFTPPPGGKLVGYIKTNLSDVARQLTKLKGDYVILVRSFQHAVLGERFPVEIGSPIPNRLIFKKGDLVYEATIDGTKDYFDIYDQLLYVIRNRVGVEAIVRGLFPNPEDRTVGEFNDQALKKLAREIKKANRKVKVEFYAKEDTYTLGPLELDFWMKE